MKNDLKNSVVCLTGASAGVGRAVARLLGQKKCKVGLLARGRDGLEACAQEIRDSGGSAIPITADVSKYEELESAAKKIEETFGPIDLWINNAMVSMYSPFWEIAPEEYRHITEVTYLGQVYGTMIALGKMRPRNKGTIVQVGSALAHRSIPLQSAYCGAKHAVAGFTESLWCELLHEKSDIKISIVQLPGVNTPQFTWTKNKLPHKARPTGPIFQPEVAAEGIIFAAEHPWRKEIVVGGPALEAIIGEKFIPGILDHYLSHNAWEGAQLPEEEDPNRKDNFWSPLPGDYGARGKFTDVSKPWSLELWMTKNRNALLAGFAAVGALALGRTLKRFSQPSIG